LSWQGQFLPSWPSNLLSRAPSWCATSIDRMHPGFWFMIYSTFPPNPSWHFGSHNMAAYASAVEKIAWEKQCAFADVHGNWIKLLERKKCGDLLGNNINHPNDFGHWVYFQVLESLGL